MKSRQSALMMITLGVLLAACGAPSSEATPALPPTAAPTAGEETVGIANPASVYCHEQGYTSETRQDAEGNQYGVCLFPDGSECVEWAYYRGECAPPGVEWSLTITEASVAADGVSLAGVSDLPPGACIQTQLFTDMGAERWWPAEGCALFQDGVWQMEAPLGLEGAPEALDPTLEYTLHAWVRDNPTIAAEPLVLDVGPVGP